MRKFGKGLFEYLMVYISLFVIVCIYFAFYYGLSFVAPVLIVGLLIAFSYKIYSFFIKTKKGG